MTAVTAAEASVGGATNGELAERAVEQVFFAVKAGRASGGLPAGRAFSHELNSVADRRGRYRKVFQDLRSLRQQPVTVKNLRVAFFQRVIETPVGFAQQTPADLVDTVVIK